MKKLTMIVLLGMVFLVGCGMNVEKMNMKANKLYMRGEYEKAIAIYKKIIKKYPNSPYADIAEGEIIAIEPKKEYKIAESLQAESDYKGAYSQYEKIVQKYPYSHLAIAAKSNMRAIRTTLRSAIKVAEATGKSIHEASGINITAQDAEAIINKGEVK